MKENNIIHISENKTIYRFGWAILFIIWIYFTYLGFKYIPYTFLVEIPELLILFWIIELILAGIVSYSFVWIFLIDKILGPEATKKRNKNKELINHARRKNTRS